MAVNLSDLKKMQGQSVHAAVDNMGSVPYFVLSLASYGDGMPEWGSNPTYRDYVLRKFWPTEPWLSATISSLAARNAAFSWTLEGPPRTCARIQETLHLSEMGAGWIPLIQKVSEDLLTQDNGAFIEIIRDGEGPNGALLGLSQLDAGQCVRTGNIEYPVLYTDREGARHKMKWHQVLSLTDFPSPIESMNGMQMCAVSRILRSAQILRDTAIYQQEKVGGRNPGKLYVVSGVSTQVLEDALTVAANNADNKGLTRYQTPAILGTLDPTATVSVAEIALKNLPDGFDVEKDMKWYIALLALAFGCEYQDLAPLPGGGLGTSQQSTILHLKARGKGPELFQKLMEHSFNFQILPQNVTFKFDEKDYEAQRIEAEVKRQRAETRKLDIESGAITPQVARQMMQDDGDLSDEYLQMLEGEDVTDVDTVQDDERHQEAEEVAQQPAPEAVPPAVPRSPEQQQAVARLTKQLQDGDYWAAQRTRLEREYEQEVAAILGDIRERVGKRLTREVNRG